MIRSAIFILGWTLITLICGVLFLPALISQRATWFVSSIWAHITLAWLRMACGIRSQVRGREHLKSGTLVASKHQSTWDTLMLWNVLGNPAFILKRSLYFIPIFGWYLARGGHIGIDRKSGRNAMRTILDAAPKILAQGRGLVIFPEGTRLRPDQQKPFHLGVARLSRDLQLPVTPVALNAGKFWPKFTHSLRKTPGTAVLEFLPPVAPCGDDQQAWIHNLQNTMNERSAALVRA